MALKTFFPNWFQFIDWRKGGRSVSSFLHQPADGEIQSHYESIFLIPSLHLQPCRSQMGECCCIGSPVTGLSLSLPLLLSL